MEDASVLTAPSCVHIYDERYLTFAATKIAEPLALSAEWKM